MTFSDFWASAKDPLTFFLAAAGLGLGVWNRLEQWRETRKKIELGLPSATLRFDGQEQPEDAKHSVRRLAVDFKNPTQNRWIVDSVTLLKPEEAGLKRITQAGQETEEWAKAVSVEWALTALQEDGVGNTPAYLQMRFKRHPVLADPKLREVTVEARIHEVGDKHRRRTVRAHWVQFF